ncbi:MAG: nitroreductase [Muribaculum sp.]|nr:nitroreductase [Muribaculum sp.]
MTLLEAIHHRHSVRRYEERPLATDAVEALEKKMEEINKKGNLHIQIVLNEPKAFKGGMAYGVFKGVTNYLVVAGGKSDSLGERAGYYGEELVLFAQTLGIDSCWVGLTYNRIADAFTLNTGEKIVAYIALGYGTAPGRKHKRKSIKDVSNASDDTPEWFVKGVEAALLAPTAINQQKFYFKYLEVKGGESLPTVEAKRLFSLAGYTKVDLGIVKLHFEIGAGKDNFKWAAE